jgi:hypothetical protein
MTRSLRIALVALAPYVASTTACDLPPSEWTSSDGGRYEPVDTQPTLPRVVAIGDLHGDLSKARAALRLAGAIDENDAWIGGDLVVVQTGDVVDRGPYDREILDLLERLSHEAASEGGAVHRVLGNHEYGDTAGIMSYVPLRGFWSFFDMWDEYVDDPALADYEDYERPRRGAFLPGGPYAQLVSGNDLILKLDGTVYVHGSLLPEHAMYGIERMNGEMRSWLRGETADPPSIAVTSGSPFYSRKFGYEVDDGDCAVAREALSFAGASRMVIGHTVQSDGVNSVCGGRVYRIDTGMSSYYQDGPVEILEITPQGIRTLGADGVEDPDGGQDASFSDLEM